VTPDAAAGSERTPAMSVVEKRNFSLMHLVTGALGRQPEQAPWINQQ